MSDSTQAGFDLSEMKSFVNEANVFMKQLREESDRGAALVGIAYLDELLVRLFKARMVLSEKLGKDLFKGFGPLASLSARTKVAYGLGCIGPETFHDLNLLRDLRNVFAHAHAPVTFDDVNVQERCRNLELPKALRPARLAKARDQFLFAASMLALRLEYYRRGAQTPAPGWDPPVTGHDPSEGVIIEP